MYIVNTIFILYIYTIYTAIYMCICCMSHKNMLKSLQSSFILLSPSRGTTSTNSLICYIAFF